MGVEYQFKHDSTIIAFHSYPWKNHVLIMIKKDRTVICSIPFTDIQYSKSWIKTKSK